MKLSLKNIENLLFFFKEKQYNSLYSTTKQIETNNLVQPISTWSIACWEAPYGSTHFFCIMPIYLHFKNCMPGTESEIWGLTHCCGNQFKFIVQSKIWPSTFFKSTSISWLLFWCTLQLIKILDSPNITLFQQVKVLYFWPC